MQETWVWSLGWLGRSPGKGKGYPLQYSGLENSTDSIVHRVTKSQTWLSDFQFTSVQVLWEVWFVSKCDDRQWKAYKEEIWSDLCLKMIILAAAWKIDLGMGRRGSKSGSGWPVVTATGKEKDYSESRWDHCRREMCWYRMNFGGCPFYCPPPSPPLKAIWKGNSQKVCFLQRKNWNLGLSASKFKAHACLTLKTLPLETVLSLKSHFLSAEMCDSPDSSVSTLPWVNHDPHNRIDFCHHPHFTCGQTGRRYSSRRWRKFKGVTGLGKMSWSLAGLKPSCFFPLFSKLIQHSKWIQRDLVGGTFMWIETHKFQFAELQEGGELHPTSSHLAPPRRVWKREKTLGTAPKWALGFLCQTQWRTIGRNNRIWKQGKWPGWLQLMPWER